MKLVTAALSLAMVALPAGAIAQTQRTCISTAENEALVGYILPTLVNKIAQKCGPTASFLRANGSALSGDLTPAADAAWPAARVAAERIGKTRIPAGGIGANIAKSVLAPALADGIVKGFTDASCATTDRLVEQLAPLPPRNLANVLALFLELGIANNDKVPYKVCA